MPNSKTNDELNEENQRLRAQLEESDAIVEAIRKGIVDAVVVSTPGESVYLLEGADRPYRLLIEAMQQAVAVLNLDGVILFCNPCFANLLNIPIEVLIGSVAHTYVADVDQVIFSDMLRTVENAPVEEEVLVTRKNGTAFPAAIALTVLPMRKVCLLVTDLSQQKVYEDLVHSKTALRESEIRYRRLFETAKDGILILDAQTGRITAANPYMSELLGYSINYFSGKELWEIGLFSDKSANESAVRELQEHGYIRYENLPLEMCSGQRVEVEVIANSYRVDDHSVIQCNIRNITDRCRLETERNRLQSLMRQQSVAMEDLHRRKDEFLAMLSHELRNPLSPIVSALQLLSLQKNEDRLQIQARTIIERQVGQLTRLIDDLLEVSRITTGRIHLQQARVNLNGIVENAVETVRPLIDQRKHNLTLSLSSEALWLFADAARLEQVVVNLLTNAAKFTDGGGQIWLTVQRDGDECEVRVRDNGVGIAPELLPQVFDLFTQADRSLNRSQGGLGIGLALVKRLVEKHKGRVEVQSFLGHGSEFKARFPLLSSVDLPSISRQNSTADISESSLRILVVDDNADAAEMLGMLLLESGHVVLTAHDGPSTLDAALDFLPNVVLLDIGLPGMNGYEVAIKLRQHLVLKNMVLVAMTGYGQESDRQRSREAGFDHHMVKPTDFTKLKQLLATVSISI